MKVTIYNSLVDTTNPMYLDVFKVADLIKTGGKQKKFIEDLRSKSKEEYKEGKKSLPIILFGGEFEKRSKDGLINHSGLLILDFDKVVNPEKLKEKIESKPYVLLNFKSPSNDGYKTIVKIPKVKSDEEYKVFFKAIQKDFPEMDESGKDISRATFFSHDPAIYINRYATEYKIQETKTVTAVKDWSKVNRVLRKIEDAVDGEKHIVRLKMSHLMGGWVASKALTYADALDLLENAVRKNTTDFPRAMIDVRDGLMAGMNRPLSMNEETQVLDMKVGIGKVYYHLDEVWEKVKQFYETGYVRGLDTGWSQLDEVYSVLMGTTTIIYAHPYSGKSQLWNEILVNLSTNYGLNHVLLSPEGGEIEHVFGELISIHAGQTMIGDYKMSEEQFKISSDFIRKHFFLMDTFGENFNIRDFFTQVEAIERTYNIKIHTTTIDPLNYLDHVHPSLRSDKAQDKDLDLFNANARKYGRHNCIITHVRDMDTIKKGGKNTDEPQREWLPIPRPRDILNGQSFWRKGMNMFCTYRPIGVDLQPLEGKLENQTDIIISKVKPKGVGRAGSTVSLYYDWKKNRYYQMEGFNKVYAKGFTPQEEVKTEVSTRMTHKWDIDEDAPF